MNETIDLNNISKLFMIYFNVSLIFVIWTIFYSELVIVFRIIVVFMGLSVLFYVDLKVYSARVNYSKKEALKSSLGQNDLLEGKSD